MGRLLTGAACFVFMCGAAAAGDRQTGSSSTGYLGARRANAAGIVDMVLMYQGGIGRPKWTPQELAPYVSWRDDETSGERWLFDAFLFLELRTKEDSGLTKDFGKRPANKAEWQEYLDSMFVPGEALDALDQQVAAATERIGAPPRGRKVVLSPPEAIEDQRDWGELDGCALDFRRMEDRLRAYQWFTEQLYRRFQAAAFKHVWLSGMYWLPEHVQDRDSSFTQYLAEFCHRHELKTFYIPYFGAEGAQDYRQHGFDVAWLQPNYFFTPTVPEQRLHDATDIARNTNMGLEMEWDERALDVKTSATFAPRMWSYLDVFRAEGVWTEATVAHYEGGGALLQLSRSADVANRKLFNAYCRILAQRQ